jgi:precorrin-3B synthase
VLATHQAADGAVARVRVPGGQLTAAAFAVIASAAAELGNGTVELTSRANLQVRGLADGSELAARLTSAGLLPSATHERVRNILGSPLTGLDGTRPDIRDLVRELDEALCARPALADLPGRFLFAVDDGRGDVAWLDADVAALLTSTNTAAILLGGEDVGLRAPVPDVINVMLACAEAFLTLRTTEWRLSELADGPRRVAAQARGGRSRKQTPQRSRHPGDAVTPVVTLSAGTDKTGPSGIGPVGGSLVVGAPLGWLDTRQAAALVATGAPLVITPWRRIVIASMKPELADVGLLVDPDDPLATVSACTGRPGCAKALADVRADAHPIPGATLPVHWSGCARRCGRPRGTVVDVVATGDGYSVTQGDR